MTELEYLRQELQLAEASTQHGAERGTRIYFYTAVKPLLDEAWELVAVEGWKGDWQKAAKHTLLSLACGRDVRDTRDLGDRAVFMVTRWLNGLQPAWTSADPDAQTQGHAMCIRRKEVVALLTKHYRQAVWERAEEYQLAHDRKFYRCEAVPMSAETEKLIAEMFDA